MEQIFKQIRNIVPYLLLISIYFLFVNIEASKQENRDQDNEINNQINDVSELNDKHLRIAIPVIPFKE